MTIIVAADTNWAIGNKDDLLVRIKEDHKNFKELTTGHTVVLGRKTLCTFPGVNMYTIYARIFIVD